ncbi:putative nicotinamide N-methyltransferase [Nadsonia fulvescens var. elongata DSM 6958]|uniref:Protein N-terminal and lysine N-methyltransferase EFM7 n=1 Tax=Nadsonia fulvescens var. elongata DSM 6958 TaxID=857566 RepID=A0A1E3PN72_9ASCO|nr:putative nicotinamide N-methyltransferase [Nadsonia fulvescens var. elongata DSM 6958]
MFDSDDETLATDLFAEPTDYYQKPEPATFDTYVRPTELIKSGQVSEYKLRLVGKSPLWGHLLWNAGRKTASYLDEHAAELVQGKTVLELGAAAAVPSFVCASVGQAKRVVVTDYPDVDLISNIQYNIDHIHEGKYKDTMVAEGYIWGNDPTELLAHTARDPATDQPLGFDLMILSDVVFNHTEHRKLIQTVLRCMAKEGKALVVFSPHRPWLLAEDLAFFDLAQSEEFNLQCDKLFEIQWEKPMFEEDEETKEIRQRVYGYMLTKK